MIANYTSGTLAKSYLWGTDLSGGQQGAGGVGGLLQVTDHGSPSTDHFYPTYDGNGNVSEYLDATGATVAHYEYSPFGRVVASAGARASDFEHKFSSKPQDAETGLYYYGYRYYDPVTGRWPSRNPIGELGGVNLYNFLENDALNYFDLLGWFKIYGHHKEVGHVGVSFTIGGQTTNWDFGRYQGKYPGLTLKGPNILKYSPGDPKIKTDPSTKDTYREKDFPATSELEKRLSNHFGDEFLKGQKDLPQDLKDRLGKDPDFELPINERYMGDDWSLFGRKCINFTFGELLKALNNVINDPCASDELKEEAKKMKEAVEFEHALGHYCDPSK